MKVTLILVLYSLLYFTPSVLSRSTKCRPGYYITDSKSCQKCPRGFFQPDSNQTGCKPCPDGEISMNEGSTKCVKCGKHKTPSEFKNECKCVVGAFRDRKGNCNLCKPGTYSEDYEGEPECRLCWPGTHQPERGQSSCLQCPDGTSSPEGATKCLSCPKWHLPLRNGKCLTCPPGRMPEESRTCVKCDEGTFKAKTGIDPCIPCPPNTISGPGASKCEPESGKCPEGEAEIGKKGKCGKCPAGSYYISRRKACAKCSLNYFMPFEGIARACYPCAGTSFTKMEGSKKCVECPPGQRILDKDGKRTCGSCPPGTQYDSWALTCDECRFGEYGIGGNCDRCPHRTYSLPGSSTCFTCPHGQALLSETEKCGVCPAGFYYDNFYTGKCFECWDGTFTSSPGIGRCKYCPLGIGSNKNKTACESK